MEASKDIFRPALKIVEENWKNVVDENDFRLLKPDSLKRVANRHRQGNRPKEPLPNQTLFEVSFVPDLYINISYIKATI